ncbi:hypothetical protein FHG87_022729 [Trinorchestia longiramus]|nr:hypothetical protein FHG87_022729 [Trinorchestia longiramus]
MDPKVTINYPCSKCEAPIQLDAGFSHMSEHIKAELSLQVFKGSEFLLPTEDETASACLDRVVMPLTLSHESSGDTLLQFSNITGLDSSSYSYSDQGYTVLGCPSHTIEKTPALKRVVRGDSGVRRRLGWGSDRRREVG